jgi:hypothetical protein
MGEGGWGDRWEGWARHPIEPFFSDRASQFRMVFWAGATATGDV